LPAPERIETVLQGWIDRAELEPDFDAEPELANHPDLGPELRRRWNALRDAGLVGAGPATLPLDEPLPDRPLAGRYECHAEIGRGGMSRVLSATDLELDRPVAVKIVALDRLPPAVAARFSAEARLTARLEHPAIVPVHDLGVEEGRFAFFVMKRVRGRSLREWLERRANGDVEARQLLSTGGLLRILRALGGALAFAHSTGVVHRDLKPANVMIGAYGEVLLMDWGIAKVLDQLEGRAAAGDRPDGLEKTASGVVMGTWSYMAPEQARGEVETIDARTDVFGLGALLHHLLYDRPPYTGRTREELISRACEARRSPPPPGVLDRVPRELRAICERALSRAPAQRYPSVEALLADLESYEQRRPGRAWRDLPHERLAKLIARRPVASMTLALVVVVGLLVQSRILWARVRTARDDLALLGSTREVLASRSSFSAFGDKRDEARRIAGKLEQHGLRLDRPDDFLRRFEGLEERSQEVAAAVHALLREEALLLARAGAWAKAEPDGVVPPAERGLDEDSVERLSADWESCEQDLVQLWCGLAAVLAELEDDPWRRQLWDAFGSIVLRGETPTGLQPDVAGMPFEDRDWFAGVVSTMGGSRYRDDLRAIVRTSPASSRAHELLSRHAHGNAKVFADRYGPWRCLRSLLEAEEHGLAWLALNPQSVWARNHLGIVQGDLARQYFLAASTLRAELAEMGLRSQLLEGVAAGYESAGISWRMKAIELARASREFSPSPSSDATLALQLAWASRELAEDVSPSLRATVEREHGITPDSLADEARELVAAVQAGDRAGDTVRQRCISVLELLEGRATERAGED